MKVFYLEVDAPVRGWIRCGGPYKTREAAASWRKFVKAYWYATRSRIVAEKHDPNGEG